MSDHRAEALADQIEVLLSELAAAREERDELRRQRAQRLRGVVSTGPWPSMALEAAEARAVGAAEACIAAYEREQAAEARAVRAEAERDAIADAATSLLNHTDPYPELEDKWLAVLRSDWNRLFTLLDVPVVAGQEGTP